MLARLKHRGPDDRGTWTEPQRGVALGQTRLSILDLSQNGHQPMESACGRYVITYNGEIYNFPALRAELEAKGARFRGTSDTEVLLAAVTTWGLTEALRRSVGMFAFALWDRRAAKLHLVRDRVGKKPLYYGWCGDTFLFGSELKALRAHPHFRADLNRDAITLYLRHSCIPAPYCIYRGISKLTPATILTLEGRNLTQECYWSARSVALEGLRHPVAARDGETLDRLDTLLREATRQRMNSDVPLGAFLSGGVDSSLVVALMQAQSSRPVRTFSIGYHDPAYDEADSARAVAQSLGSEHTELYISWEEAMNVVPLLPTLYDEPFSDSSQIPTYLVSQLARTQVTVCLTGDGGDEGFGGYNRYVWATRVWRRMGRLPTGLRRILAGLLSLLPPNTWNDLYRRLAFLLPARWSQRLPGDKLQKLAAVLSASGPKELYRGIVSHWSEPTSVVLDAEEPASALTAGSRLEVELPNFGLWMMYMDLVTYLPDDILTKVDRATMGVSLEARNPLLDHRVLEFAWRLPMDWKIRNGVGKWVLRRLLRRYLPASLFERPKMGFQVPIDRWLRGPLRSWAEELLEPGRLRRQGLLRPEPIQVRWREHLSERRNWAESLWDVLMLCAWLEQRREVAS
ncbi:MAG: asparagine synthetase B [Candidatus Xenobia bacterium]